MSRWCEKQNETKNPSRKNAAVQSPAGTVYNLAGHLGALSVTGTPFSSLHLSELKKIWKLSFFEVEKQSSAVLKTLAQSRLADKQAGETETAQWAHVWTEKTRHKRVLCPPNQKQQRFAEKTKTSEDLII